MTQPGRCSRLSGHGDMELYILRSIPLHATLTTVIKAQRNECTFYNCVQGLLDRKAAIQPQERRIDQGLPVRDGDGPVPLTKSEKNHLIRLHSTVPVQVRNVLLNVFVRFERREDRSMDFICVCRKPFLTRDSLSKHYNAQVLPDDLEVANASGRVVGATIREFMRGSDIANTQQQHEQRTLITAMEQRVLSSIAQIAAGQGQGQAMQAASASASGTGPSSPVSTSRKRTRSKAPHFGTFKSPSRMSPTENK
ncbi:hypothetical protein BC939DRAFT_461229 [Gamsiella multidivaricata]|uniref:uncharacterized protein n=1 Tax=Gamsiella multidivaricata TaxID=101098 RepID=UPI00221F59AE|nr:uncharacterized protein BC939DRAFT_461229 [Gamsiella multidivaricata]KAI7818983.1 hypothetical protein BC939DRAFT_461229 [Gamsiella multidivaricata]